MPDIPTLSSLNSVIVSQKKEFFELIGFETKNQYAILSPQNGQIPIMYAAESGQGVLGFLFRQFLGHWRKFEIVLTNPQKELLIRAEHPFRFILQELSLYDYKNRFVGRIKQRFSIFYKHFEFYDSSQNLLFTTKSPIWRIWTFPVMHGTQEVASIQKKWSGLLKEAFTDADNFKVEFKSEKLRELDRYLLVAGALFVDLVYFEKKAK